MLFQAKENTREAHKIRLSSVPNHLVEATGFEPAASASRTQRSTKLSHASIFHLSVVTRDCKNYYIHFGGICQHFFQKSFKKYPENNLAAPKKAKTPANTAKSVEIPVLLSYIKITIPKKR